MVTYLPWGFGLRLVRVLEVGGAITLTGCCAIASTTVLGAISFAGAPWAIALSGNPAVAQITPDATLGAESSVITPNVNIRGLPGDRIDGGAVRGTNLFHSFQEFNVGDGQRVYFANPTGIETILSRITGNNLSNILGTLGVNGGASLFLLNPNGIIFGPNAQLDISGSFFASTANSAVFGNGYQFSAKNPEAPPLLTINVPLGVQYGSNQPRATIRNTGALAVGQNFTLNAGNLDLQGLVQAGKFLTLEAQNTVKVRDGVTNPFIAAAGGKLLVQGNGTVDIFALNHANSGFFSGGDMVLRSPNSVMGDAHYNSGGNFRIEQLDGSLGNLSSPNDPIIRASGDVNFDTYTGTSLHILAGGSVTIGNITITGADATGNTINPTATPILANVKLSDDTPLVINGATRPTLDIRAGTTAFGTPEIIGNNYTILAPIPNTTAPAIGANITIGSVTATAPDSLVFLTNQYQRNPALTGNIQATNIWVNDRDGGFSGNGGNVIIDSRGDITLPNSGRIRTFSGTGNAGNVTLIANSLFLMNPSSRIETVTSGQGNAGNVTIKVGDAVFQDNSGILATVERNAVGNGGDINIEAGSLSLEGGSQLLTIVRGASGLDSAGQGNAGNVTINVRDAVVLGGAGQFSNAIATVNLGWIGNSGNINITAGSLSITDGALFTYATGQGKAGNITINVRDTFTIAGTNPVSGSSNRLFAGTVGASNQAGIIDINAGTVRIANGAVVNASSYNSANGGDIKVNANVLELTGGGQILALPYAQGNGGNVTLNVKDRLTIFGKDPTFESRALQFGPNIVSNQGGASGIFTGYGLGASAAIQNIPVESTGNAGNIFIIGPRELNIDGGQLFTAGFNSGNGGTLSITETGAVNLTNTGLIVTSTFGTGNAGGLLIDVGKLNLQNQSLITSSTAGAGNAGELNIRASDSVAVLSGSRIASETVGSGNGGNLTVDTRRLITRNGDISTSTTPESSGRGGNLRVVASDSVDISGEVGTAVGGLYSSTLGSGQGGNLTVETARLSVRDGGRIEAGTGGIAPGGNVTVNASDSIELIGTSAVGILPNGVATVLPSGISSFSLQLGSGDGGDVNLTTGNLTIRDGAEVTTRSEGKGKAGDISANVTNNLRLSRGNITATSLQAGGGDINLTADDIRLNNSSLISTSVKESTGGGGNIRINSTVFFAIEDSDILANAEAGPGGDIFIKSEAFLANIFGRGLAIPVGRNPGDFAKFRGNNRVDISADSRIGKSGTVFYPDIEQIRGVPALPSDLVDAEELIDRHCTSNSSAKQSSFTITGRGGLPPSPNEPLMYQDVLVDWITLEETESNGNSRATDAKPTRSSPQQLVEAQGWVMGANGQVILTASPPSTTPRNSGLALPSCEENQTTTH